MKRPNNIHKDAAGFYYAAIFNQIHTSRYYHISFYKKNTKTGRYAFERVVCGHRGHGGNLGMSWKEAREKAEALNLSCGFLS